MHRITIKCIQNLIVGSIILGNPCSIPRTNRTFIKAYVLFQTLKRFSPPVYVGVSLDVVYRCWMVDKLMAMLIG